jgi:hypothetical protein
VRIPQPLEQLFDSGGNSQRALRAAVARYKLKRHAHGTPQNSK